MTQAKSKHGRNAGIDALRAYAMTLVIAQHCDLLPFGWIGVWVFFVISGFVVTSSIIDGRDHDQPAVARIKSFYQRRVARIMPLYFCYILLFIVVALLSWRMIPWQVLATLGTFTYNFYPIHDDSIFPISHLWTISVEMQFYVVAGLVLILGNTATIKKTLYLFVAAPVFIRILYSIMMHRSGYAPGFIQSSEYHISIFHFDAFAIGCLLSYNRQLINRRFANRALLFGLVAMAVFLLVYSRINIATRNVDEFASFKNILSGDAYGQLREALIFVPVLALSFGLVLSSLVETSWLRGLFQHDWIAYIGRCSYSGYMIHFAVIWALRGIGESVGLSDAGDRSTAIITLRVVLFLLSTSLTIGLSTLLFRWLEQPLAGVAKRLMTPSSASRPA